MAQARRMRAGGMAVGLVVAIVAKFALVLNRRDHAFFCQ